MPSTRVPPVDQLASEYLVLCCHVRAPDRIRLLDEVLMCFRDVKPLTKLKVGLLHRGMQDRDELKGRIGTPEYHAKIRSVPPLEDFYGVACDRPSQRPTGDFHFGLTVIRFDFNSPVHALLGTYVSDQCPTVDDFVVVVRLNVESLASNPERLRAALCPSIFEAIDRNSRILSGFARCELQEISDAGEIYTGLLGSDASIPTVMEQLCWTRALEHDPDLIRGVYWANIWGPGVAARLRSRGLESLVRDHKVAKAGTADYSTVRKVYKESATGSIYWSLTTDPLTCSCTGRRYGEHFNHFSDTQSPFAASSAWIWLQLRKAGMLL